MYYVIALGLHASEAYRSVLRRIMVRKRPGDEDAFEAVCSAAAITQGRKRLGWQPMRDLYRAVVGPLATRSSVGAWYRRWRLVVLDGSVLDVADTRKNERAFGRALKQVRGHARPRHLASVARRCAVLFLSSSSRSQPEDGALQ